MIPAVPLVEIAHDRDSRGRRRPHRKRHAGHAAERAHVRAELFVDAVLVALVEQVEILVAQRWQKAVRIEELANLAVGVRRA